jgi:hypothetical protein
MAYEFNGTNQFLNTPTTQAVVSGMPLTMACWFYPNNITEQHTLVTLANQMSDAGGGYFGMWASGNVSGDPVRIATDGAGNTVAATTSGFSASQWNHACGVFSSSTSRTVYLNAANSATNTVSNSPVAPNQGMRIGRFVNISSFYMNGRIAEVGIWNAALTAAEIASLAKGMTCDKVRPQSLVFYSPLVRDLIDQKGGLTITNNNAATVANHPRVYA